MVDTAQNSADTAGFRPNFQLETGLVCLLPELSWNGYPPQTGSVGIMYHPESIELVDEYQPGDHVPSSCQTKTMCKLMFILFLVVMTLVFLQKKNI